MYSSLIGGFAFDYPLSTVRYPGTLSDVSTNRVSFASSWMLKKTTAVNRERRFNGICDYVSYWEVRLKAGYDLRVVKGVRSTFEPSKHRPTVLLPFVLLFPASWLRRAIRNRRWDPESRIGSSNSLSSLAHVSLITPLSRATVGNTLAPGQRSTKHIACAPNTQSQPVGWAGSVRIR